MGSCLDPWLEKQSRLNRGSSVPWLPPWQIPVCSFMCRATSIFPNRSILFSGHRVQGRHFSLTSLSGWKKALQQLLFMKYPLPRKGMGKSCMPGLWKCMWVLVPNCGLWNCSHWGRTSGILHTSVQRLGRMPTWTGCSGQLADD